MSARDVRRGRRPRVLLCFEGGTCAGANNGGGTSLTRSYCPLRCVRTSTVVVRARRSELSGSWAFDDESEDEMDESTSAGLEWTLDEENEILPDDSLADVQLSRAVQEMLWQWPRGKVLLRVSAKGMKEHQRQRVRAALLGLDGAKQQLVVAVEVVKEADLEVVVRDLRACGGATQPLALASAPSSRAVPEPLDRGSSAPLSSVLQHTVMPTHDRLIERPVRVLGTLDLFRKNIVLLGNAEFVATLLPDPYLITTL